MAVLVLLINSMRDIRFGFIVKDFRTHDVFTDHQCLDVYEKLLVYL